MEHRDEVLRFRATRVSSEDIGLSFEVEADGEPSTYFSMMVEDQNAPPRVLVRVWWGDGANARDEVVHGLLSASLDRSRFRASFETPLPANGGRYAGVDVTFDPLEGGDAPALAETLVRLAGSLGDRLVVDIPGFVRSTPSTPTVDRKRGAPMLALAARGDWRARVASEVALGLELSNLGGPFAADAAIEIGGEALALVAPERVDGSSLRGLFERSGAVARASLGRVALPGDLDLDRRISPGAAPPPTIRFDLVLRALRPGGALLTVRLVPTPAMCGRRLVVEEAG